jgi:hypothetical protein
MGGIHSKENIFNKYSSQSGKALKMRSEGKMPRTDQ